ncbi:unnamed protein product [Coffea canephora]|uniref:Myb-related protein Myb4-like n=2 Tax=Coffea TaxID=13442 RepID=A0A068UW92_COFCA|nr:unnamed protein product [Coffea canephora]
MVRSPYIDKKGLKKGAWSEDEDNKLRAYVLRYGHWNWRQLPKFAGLSRCGKSCRLRWMNYLRPGLKRGNYTVEEEDLIIKLHEQLGNRWSAIAGKLPGRSDNEVKNFWHTRLRKRINQDPRSTKIIKQTSDQKTGHMHDANQIKLSAGISDSDSNEKREMEPNIAAAAPVADTKMSSLICDSSLSDSNSSVEYSFAESFESFWTQPFILDASHNSNVLALPPMEEEFTFLSPPMFIYDGMD